MEWLISRSTLNTSLHYYTLPCETFISKLHVKNFWVLFPVVPGVPAPHSWGTRFNFSHKKCSVTKWYLLLTSWIFHVNCVHCWVWQWRNFENLSTYDKFMCKIRVCCFLGSRGILCYLIIRNAEASLVEIKSRDRHYKHIASTRPRVQYDCKQFIVALNTCTADSYAWNHHHHHHHERSI